MGLFFIVGEEDHMYDRHPSFMKHLHKLDISFNYRVQNNLGHNLWRTIDLFAGEAMRFPASHYDPST